ncbi:hypothetical protein [Falsiroseomonas selenitidurans]|uniref:Uncharacterized protein n=1 Tax=Falsiroseomonas selenitidurans TaxID=2716335 RepID=A0ABX1E8I1_9PROT|nr:hypothetical protein [Falsiroseomonas selenitidurans]NKC33497.1 hypothetical protein [Falsiroseomonas selenitidurans]
MSTTITQRMMRSCVAVKIETTRGTDAIAGTPVAGDYITATFTERQSREDSPRNVYTASYDDPPPIPGGLRGSVEIRVPIVGSGAAGTAPEWGRLLQLCRWEEAVTASAVGAPTAAASGTATTATAASPFGTTAQAYRGMPILLAGNPSTAVADAVLDYTAGRVVTLGRTYSPVLDSNTTLQIPVNVLYRPTSDETVEKTATVYLFRDGLRHKMVGCVGTFRLGLRSGQPADLVFTLVGQVTGWNEAVALPTAYVPVTRNPPRWAEGVSRFNRALARMATLSFDGGVRAVEPSDPESINGRGLPLITGAGGRWTLDPHGNTTDSPLRQGLFSAGTYTPLVAAWGSTAGNRFMISCPEMMLAELGNAERDGLGVDAMAGVPSLGDAPMFLACY